VAVVGIRDCLVRAGMGMFPVSTGMCGKIEIPKPTTNINNTTHTTNQTLHNPIQKKRNNNKSKTTQASKTRCPIGGVGGWVSGVCLVVGEGEGGGGGWGVGGGGGSLWPVAGRCGPVGVVTPRYHMN